MVNLIVYIQLTNAGGTAATYFDLYSDVTGFATGQAFETTIPKALLLAGYTSYVVPDGTTIIRVQASSKITPCTNYVDIIIQNKTGTLASTTTMPPIIVPL